MKDLGYNERTGEFIYLPGDNHRKHKLIYGTMALIIIVLLILLFYVWATSRSTIYKRKPLYNIELHGYIKHAKKDIGFTMRLQINENEVIGTEHYNSQKRNKTLQIKGTINDGIMTLYEKVNNSNTGTFCGKLKSSSYSGTFTDKKGGKYSFIASVLDEDTSLIINDDEISSTGLAILQERLSNVSGTGRDEYIMESNNKKILDYRINDEGLNTDIW